MSLRTAYLALVLVVIASCASAPPPPSSSGPAETPEEAATPRTATAEGQVQQWRAAREERDGALLAEQYWPDARLMVLEADRTSNSLNGAEAIRAYHERRWRAESGPGSPTEIAEHDPDQPEGRALYRVTRGEPPIAEFLFLEQRADAWRITLHEIIHPEPGAFVTSRYQSGFDTDGDGFLQPPEEERLTDAVRRLLEGPHPVETEVCEFFDRTGDGRIDAEEIDRARDVLLVDGFTRMKDSVHHEWAVDILDLDGDEQVSAEEIEEIAAFIGSAAARDAGRPAESLLDRAIDADGDGALAEWELREREQQWLSAAVAQIFPDEVLMPVPRDVSNALDSIADVDQNGVVDEAEHETLHAVLSEEHRVSSYVGWKIDENRDGFIEYHEIQRARQASAMGWEESFARARPPFPVRTAADEVLDTNGDGEVSDDELGFFVELFVGGAEQTEAWPSAARMIDFNGNDTLEADEIEHAWHAFGFPHPADPDDPFQAALDQNGDGFVEPEELGISAGVTADGPTASLPERAEIMRWRAEQGGVAQQTEGAASGAAAGAGAQAGGQGEGAVASSSGPGSRAESEYYKRLGRIQDKKLAIVGLNVGTESVDEDTANGVIVFVENAFVNVGQVSVVDRQNIERIMEEHKFQATALTDESAAVEIGRLSGANIIVIGSINRVGARFYLNIKLIEVETGEIIGSSIADAQSAEEFLDMCNEAVYSLF